MFEAPEPVFGDRPKNEGPGLVAYLVRFVFVIIALGLIGWLFQRELRPYYKSAMAAAGIAPKADTQFQGVYDKLKMKPLAEEAASSQAIAVALKDLQAGPCDKTAIFRLSQSLLELGEKRPAVDALLGFSNSCPNGEGEQYRAADVLFGMGNYAEVMPLIDRLIAKRPEAGQYYYTRAQALQFLSRHNEAVEDFNSTIGLFDNLKQVSAAVFQEMATSYSALGRHCEAMATIQTYVYLDPASRDTAPSRKLMSDYAAKGSCEDTAAKGVEVIRKTRPDVFTAKVDINGASGTFVIDTGASVVAISEAFATRAKLSPASNRKIHVHTANGVTEATLTTAPKVTLGNVSAGNVSVAVLAKPVGDGIDGLLGMSFLARFDVSLGEKELRIQKRGGK
jgi:clan AA aspartic protease (TIGR02281 family)